MKLTTLILLLCLTWPSTTYSQSKRLRQIHPAEELQKGKVDSSVLYAADVAYYAQNGYWVYAWKSAAKSVRYLDRHDLYSTESYIDCFATAYCCNDYFGDDHPLIKELRRVLRATNEAASRGGDFLFLYSYNKPDKSFHDVQVMFMFALRNDEHGFAKAIRLLKKEIGIK